MASILIVTHNWKRPSAARDMFFAIVVVLGFVTIGFYRGSLFELMRDICRAVKGDLPE